MQRRSMAERPADTAAGDEVDFGGLLRARRERGFLSQERLAERSGLSARTIRDLETGKVRRPRVASVRLLADALRLEGWERERFEEAARPSSAGQLAGQPVPRLAEGAAPGQPPPDDADVVGRRELVRQLRVPLRQRVDGMAAEPTWPRWSSPWSSTGPVSAGTSPRSMSPSAGGRVPGRAAVRQLSWYRHRRRGRLAVAPGGSPESVPPRLARFRLGLNTEKARLIRFGRYRCQAGCPRG